MAFLGQNQMPGQRNLVLLAPRSAQIPCTFGNASASPEMHDRLLRDMQRLRGRIYCADGALKPRQLTADGRDASPVDVNAWHLLALDGDRVVGGVRMLLHDARARFADTTLSHTALAASRDWGTALATAVQNEITDAQRSGAAITEIGGWFLDERFRCSTEAIRLALGVWAWGRLLGGAVGFATATMRNHSASILSRIGGRPLTYSGCSIPAYFEPKYDCDIQILRFHTASYADRYAPVVEGLCEALAVCPVVTPGYTAVLPMPSLLPTVYSNPFALAASAA